MAAIANDIQPRIIATTPVKTLATSAYQKQLAPRPTTSTSLIECPSTIRLAAVAQWIEYWPPKPRVVGSIPASRTKLTQRTRRFVVVKPWLAVYLRPLPLLSAPFTDSNCASRTDLHSVKRRAESRASAAPSATPSATQSDKQSTLTGFSSLCRRCRKILALLVV